MIEPTISIVVLSFNTSELTVDCLKSILLDKGLKEIPYEIIVIDNNSQDDSVSQIKKIKGPIKLVENKVNLGFGKTNNQALKISQGNFILFLNSDTVILHSAISQTLNWLSTHPEAGTATAQLLNPDKSIQMSGGFFPNLANIFTWSIGLDDLPFINQIINPIHPHTPAFYTHDNFFNQDHRQDWVTGAFMMTRRELLEKVGGFDENYFMYGEELELSYRIRKQFPQLQTWYLVGPQIIHIGRASSPNKKLPIEKEYQGFITFFKKHHPHQLFLVQSLLTLNHILRQSIYRLFSKDV